MSTVTGLVGELRKETRGVVRDVVLGVGSVVTKVDNGRVCALSVLTEFCMKTNLCIGSELCLFCSSEKYHCGKGFLIPTSHCKWWK